MSYNFMILVTAWVTILAEIGHKVNAFFWLPMPTERRWQSGGGFY